MYVCVSVKTLLCVDSIRYKSMVTVKLLRYIQLTVVVVVVVVMHIASTSYEVFIVMCICKQFSGHMFFVFIVLCLPLCSFHIFYWNIFHLFSDTMFVSDSKYMNQHCRSNIWLFISNDTLSTILNNVILENGNVQKTNKWISV